MRHFIKSEGLISSSALDISSKSKIIGNIISNSSHWESRSEEHWSIDIETKFTVVSLGSNLGSFVSIDNSPSLIPAIMLLVNNNLLAFNIFVLIDINCLSIVDVNEVLSSSPEDLPPI
jgi:hypothetical protein